MSTEEMTEVLAKILQDNIGNRLTAAMGNGILLEFNKVYANIRAAEDKMAYEIAESNLNTRPKEDK